LRYSKGRKRDTHDRILRTASVQMKKHGSDGIAIAALMRKAGLTHGGFYAHFRSRDDLVEEAYSAAMDLTTSRWKKLSEGLPASKGLEAIVQAYLCIKHRDDFGGGCGLPVFAAEIGRRGKPTKISFSIKLEKMIDVVATHFPDVPTGEARRQAMSAISTMVGAMMLARASAGERLSTEILEAGVNTLLPPQTRDAGVKHVILGRTALRSNN
jgi:TetR/AcrR family transcriptional repressor of nem operon